MLTARSSTSIPSVVRGLMKKKVVRALRIARPTIKLQTTCLKLPSRKPTYRCQSRKVQYFLSPKTDHQTLKGGLPSELVGIEKSILTIDDRWESPRSNESANLSNSCSNTVILTTNSRRTRLASQETKAVTGSELTEAQEDTVDDGECSDVVGETIDRSVSGDLKMTMCIMRTACRGHS